MNNQGSIILKIYFNAKNNLNRKHTQKQLGISVRN